MKGNKKHRRKREDRHMTQRQGTQGDVGVTDLMGRGRVEGCHLVVRVHDGDESCVRGQEGGHVRRDYNALKEEEVRDRMGEEERGRWREL
jgi:hypothetical protein